MLLKIEYSVSLSEIIVVVLTIIATALGYIVKQQRDRIKEINNQLSEHKYKMYNEVIEIFFDIMKQQKGVKGLKNQDHGIRVLDVKQQMLLYAPDEIFHKFVEWTRYTANHETEDLRHFLIYLDLLILIRKDMGYPKTTFKADDFWKLIMTTDLEIAEMKSRIANYKKKDN